jgi:hypothetical protein
MDIQMLLGTETEREIPGELHIQIHKLQRARLRTSSAQLLASSRNTEEKQTGDLVRVG